MLPMECTLVSKLPEGPDWTYEVKLDGYRAIGVKTSHDAILYSRNGKNFNKRYPLIAKALHDLPDDTVIDGEVVALDDSGRPDFHALQHFQASASRIHYFVFDLLIRKGRDLTKLPLSERREHLASLKLRSPIRISEQFDISPGPQGSPKTGQRLTTDSTVSSSASPGPPTERTEQSASGHARPPASSWARAQVRASKLENQVGLAGTIAQHSSCDVR